MQDQLLGLRLGAMNASEKTRLVAEAMRDPQAHAEIIGGILRLGSLISGCDPEMVRRLHAESMQTFKPQEVDLLQAQADLLELAERADELGRQTLLEEFQISAAELDAIPDVPEVLSAAPSNRAMTTAEQWSAWAALPAAIKLDILKDVPQEQRERLLGANGAA